MKKEKKRKRKKKKLERLKRDEAAYNLHLQTHSLRKAVKSVIFHLVDKLKVGRKASSLLDEVKTS